MRLRWPGVKDNGTVLIGLAAESFCLANNDIDVSGEIFKPKDELHITVISGEAGFALLDKIQQDKTIEPLLKKIFEAIDWSFKQVGPVHILSRSKDNILQKSIIMLVDVPGLFKFYDQLKTSGLIDADVLVPPAHVTMYTFNCPLGIGVANDDELKKLSQRTLSVNELNTLAVQN